SPCPGKGRERTARASGPPAAFGVGALWNHIHSSAAAEKSQPAGSGRSAGAASASNSVSRAEAANSNVAERLPRSFIFLGALVRGLQSGGPRHCPLTAGVRSRRAGRYRADATLRL